MRYQYLTLWYSYVCGLTLELTYVTIVIAVFYKWLFAKYPTICMATYVGADISLTTCIICVCQNLLYDILISSSSILMLEGDNIWTRDT